MSDAVIDEIVFFGRDGGLPFFLALDAALATGLPIEIEGGQAWDFENKTWRAYLSAGSLRLILPVKDARDLHKHLAAKYPTSSLAVLFGDAVTECERKIRAGEQPPLAVAEPAGRA
jgi:hypothetical protein